MGLSLKGVSVAYKSKTIIENMTIGTIAPGTLVAVVGANAAGKSTLLKTLAGQLKYRGEIEFQQQPLSLMSHFERMKSVAYLPQVLPQATSLVAYEIIYSTCRACVQQENKRDIEQRVESVFNQLGIRDLALVKMEEMSGGQRQMIGLAQVLVREASLLLLDEPTSALDLHWQLKVLQAISEEVSTRQATAFVASHDLNLALRFCDQVLVLAKGSLLAIGPPEKVLTAEVLRRAYGIDGRIESCSKGFPVVLADRACHLTTSFKQVSQS